MIPNDFYLYWTGSEFSIHQYLCVKSIIDIEKANVFLYYNDPLPRGIWWEKTLKLVTLREFKFEEFNELGLSIDFQSLTPRFKSDVFSYLVLHKHGGIYTDFDTLTIKSIRPHIKNANAFLPQCRFATGIRTRNGYQPISSYKKRKKHPNVHYSHLAIGNMGSVAKHPFFRAVLEKMKKGADNKRGTFYCVQNSYELNKEKYADVILVPWEVFHLIEERSSNKFDRFKGKHSFTIEEFFQSDFKPVPDKTSVFHYYASKDSYEKLSSKLKTPYSFFCSTSTYAKYACNYLDEFLKGWKKDGFITSPDRHILEREIIPYLEGEICFVGVAHYIKHYWSSFFSPNATVTTIDVNKNLAKYGAKNHIATEIKKLPKVSKKRYDYVIMHGIAGYGTFSRQNLEWAFWGTYESLKPGGLLIYGWANNKDIRIVHPSTLPHKKSGTGNFKSVPFRKLGTECKANDFFDPDRKYNVPISELKRMDVRFMFFKKSEA